MERTSPPVTGDNSEPGLSMSRIADFCFRLVKEDRRQAGSAGWSVDVDLLHLISHHDDESHGLAVGLSHPCAFEPFPRSGYELLLVTMGDELRRNVPDVTIDPSCMPDPSNCVDVVGSCLAYDVLLASCGVVCVR
jgi:hypothetical protein